MQLLVKDYTINFSELFFFFSLCIQILDMILILVKIHFKFCINNGDLICLWDSYAEYFMPMINLVGFVFQLGTQCGIL